MPNFTFGNVPVDTTDTTFAGLGQYFSTEGFDTISQTLSRIVLRDRATETVVEGYLGFQGFNIVVTRVVANDRDGALLFDISGLAVDPDSVREIDLTPFYAGSDTILGGNQNDTLTGFGGNDSINGGGGNDRLLFSPGNDTLSGGDGLDTVVSDVSVGAFAVTLLAEGVLLTDTTGAVGTELVTWDVERAIFPETAFALDLGRGQNAGDALALLWAAFNGMPAPADLGRWIAAFDAGGTMVEVAGQMIDHYTGGAGVSNADLVTLLFANIVGRAPDANELATFVGMIDGGMSQAELFVMAADLDVNRAELAAVVGIAAPYTPFPG